MEESAEIGFDTQILFWLNGEYDGVFPKSCCKVLEMYTEEQKMAQKFQKYNFV